MSADGLTLSAAEWQQLIADVRGRGTKPTPAAVAQQLERERADLTGSEAHRLVIEAIDAGQLIEPEDGSAIPAVALDDDAADADAHAAAADADVDGPRTIDLVRERVQADLAAAANREAAAEDSIENEDTAAARTAALAAHRDAVAYCHRDEQLDAEIGAWTPKEDVETPRDGFLSRELSEETIERHQLGFAPPSFTELREHLEAQGHDRDAILGSGFFTLWDNGQIVPLFRGRYVFPYHDRDGNAVYAISRSINEKGGGHPEDYVGEQKYTKAASSKEWSHVEEPIFGLSPSRKARSCSSPAGSRTRSRSSRPAIRASRRSRPSGSRASTAARSST